MTRRTCGVILLLAGVVLGILSVVTAWPLGVIPTVLTAVTGWHFTTTPTEDW